MDCALLSSSSLISGTGESGKSTVVKQMKIIHGKGYTKQEREEFIPLIHQNIMLSMRAMLDAMRMFGLRLSSPDLEVRRRA